MSRYKLRRLTQVGPGVVDRTYHGRGAAGAFMAASDQAGAVYDISANDFEMAHDEIETQLKSGMLKPTDLVFVDGTWTTLADSIPFGDLAHEKAKSNRSVGLIAGIVLALAVFGWLASLFAR